MFYFILFIYLIFWYVESYGRSGGKASAHDPVTGHTHYEMLYDKCLYHSPALGKILQIMEI